MTIHLVIQSGCSEPQEHQTRIACGLLVVTPDVEVNVPEQWDRVTQEAVVRVKNAGVNEARVERVTTSCPCVTVKSFPEFRIRHGQECEITLQVAVPPYGEQSVSIAVHVTGEVLPLKATIRIKGRQIPFPRIIRPVAEFTVNNVRGAPVEAVVSIVTLEKQGTSPWIKGFNVDSDDFEIATNVQPEEQLVTPGFLHRKYLGTLRNSTIPPNDSIDRFLTVSTVFDKEPVTKDATFQVRIHVEDAIRLMPAVINLRRQALPVRRELQLIAGDGATWDFEPAEQLPDWIQFSFSESEDATKPPQQRQFILEFQPPRDTATKEATVILSTTHPRHPRIEIPIYVSPD